MTATAEPKHPPHACQLCGATRKLVQTLVYDEAFYDDDTGAWEFNGFTDDFDHTGLVTCAHCGEDWTGQ